MKIKSFYVSDMQNQLNFKLDQFFNAFDCVTGHVIYGNSIEFMNFIKRKLNMIKWIEIEMMNLQISHCQYVSKQCRKTYFNN